MAARTTKKDLESKIALLEKKLQKLTDSVDLQKTSPKPASVKPKGTLPKGTAPKPTPEYVKPKGTLPKTTASAPKPAPAQTKPKGTMPKGFTPESASKPKPAETKNAPTNMAQALEKAYENWPMTSTADYKAKTPGYTPAPNFLTKKTSSFRQTSIDTLFHDFLYNQTHFYPVSCSMTTNEHNKETQIDNEQLKVKYDQHVSIPMKSPRG